MAERIPKESDLVGGRVDAHHIASCRLDAEIGFEQPMSASDVYLCPSTIKGWRELLLAAEVATEPDAVILGVPFEGGGLQRGPSQGPTSLRLGSRDMKTIDPEGYDFSAFRVRDLGDVRVLAYDLERSIERILESYKRVFASFQCPVVTLGGDHSITFPIVRAAAQSGRIGLLWFDAHPDVLDVYHGSRLSHGSSLRRIIESDAVRPSDVVLIGTRAYDKGEPSFIQQEAIREFKAVEFHRDTEGTIAAFANFIREMSYQVDALYVSIDLDVIDHAAVPGTSTPVPGGLSLPLLLRLLSCVPVTALGYDLVELAQVSGMTDITLRTGIAILSHLFSTMSSISGTDSISTVIPKQEEVV